MMLSRYKLCMALVSGAVALTTGCGGAPKVETELAWPPAPADPVIVYERSIRGSIDLKRSFFGKIRDFFLGRSAETSLTKPYGIDFDGSSRLFVADTGKKAVVILDLGSGLVKVHHSLGPHGRLLEPVNVLVLDESRILVADTGLGRVVIMGHDGEFLRFLGVEEDLTAPVGLAHHEESGRIYVTDSHNHEVVVFDESGSVIRRFGKRGDERGEFYHPLGMAISGEDTLFVVDSFHFAVQAFDLDGNFLFSFGPTKAGMGSLARPRDITLVSDEYLYVTDALRNNVQVFAQEGAPVLAFGAQGTAAGAFRLPAGIVGTQEGRLYVVDSINQRIQQFRYEERAAGGARP